MFEETLEFEQIIITCYERQKTITLQQRLKGPSVNYYKNNHIMFELYGTSCEL